MAASCSIIRIQAFGSGSMFLVISWKKAVHLHTVVPGYLIHFQITSLCFKILSNDQRDVFPEF